MERIRLRIHPEVFNPVYLPFLGDETASQIFFGGSSSGKSVFLAQRMVLDILGGGHNYLVVRKVGRTLRNSVFNETNKAIARFKVQDLFATNKTDMTITCLINGFQILFTGLDDVEKLKSITPQKGVITDIWIEEATETERNDVKQLEKRLRGESTVAKRLIMSFNPILQSHWIYQEYFKGWDDSKNLYRDEHLSILRTTYKDNQFLTQEDIDRLEIETDPYYRDVYTLGKWGILGAVIFRNWCVEDCSEIRKRADLYRNGLDFGFGGHPTALAHTYYWKSHRTIYILDDNYWYGLTNDLLAGELRGIIGRQLIVADSAEPKSIQDLCNRGLNVIPAKKGKDSINYGIQWLQQQTIIIDVSCINARNEFQQYKWREDREGNILREPVDAHNHFIDALRYAYEDESGATALAGTWGR